VGAPPPRLPAISLLESPNAMKGQYQGAQLGAGATDETGPHPEMASEDGRSHWCTLRSSLGVPRVCSCCPLSAVARLSCPLKNSARVRKWQVRMTSSTRPGAWLHSST